MVQGIVRRRGVNDVMVFNKLRNDTTGFLDGHADSLAGLRNSVLRMSIANVYRHGILITAGVGVVGLRR
mgnify:CR=1 FL=1